jgi:predicted ATP-grasp superfamily ATP-dependent carboligase
MGDAPFCYAGASTASVDAALEREVQARLDRLVRTTGLRGLNGIDFLLDGRDVCALEVNPRPTATFELYDPDYAQGLLDWHVRSFAAPLPGFPGRPGAGQRPARACAIVYSEHVVRVPNDVAFPSWCRDLPVGGSTIQAGAPVLSVFAEARSEVLVQRLVRRRQEDVQLLLERWQADSPCECPA